MAVAIDFADFPGVNMQDPAGLGAAIFSAFPMFNFTTGAFDPMTGTLEIPNTANAGAATAIVRAYGNNWSFNTPDGSPNDSVAVYAFEVWVPGPQGAASAYRLVMDDINVAFSQFRSALNARDVSTLYAGQSLKILGTVSNDDTLVGGGLADEIYGDGGNDVILGNGGNDYLDGQQGRDTMAGGAGDDDYGVNNSGDVIEEIDGGGRDLVIAAASYRLPGFVENIGLFGSSAIDGTGNALANYMEGNAAANELQGLAGNDTLTGLGGNDLLNGGDGGDSLVGGTGADVLRGGNGNDSLNWHAKDSLLDGGTGSDTLKVVGSLNLHKVDNDVVVDIERISVAGGGANTLTLSLNDILDISSTTNVLRILGETGDIVNAPNNFVEMDTVGGYTRYKSGAATLWVDSDIDVI
jgi:Ca2+-binding RTX toxin-like protein